MLALTAACACTNSLSFRLVSIPLPQLLPSIWLAGRSNPQSCHRGGSGGGGRAATPDWSGLWNEHVSEAVTVAEATLADAIACFVEEAERHPALLRQSLGALVLDLRPWTGCSFGAVRRILQAAVSATHAHMLDLQQMAALPRLLHSARTFLVPRPPVPTVREAAAADAARRAAASLPYAMRSASSRHGVFGASTSGSVSYFGGASRRAGDADRSSGKKLNSLVEERDVARAATSHFSARDIGEHPPELTHLRDSSFPAAGPGNAGDADDDDEDKDPSTTYFTETLRGLSDLTEELIMACELLIGASVDANAWNASMRQAVAFAALGVQDLLKVHSNDAGKRGDGGAGGGGGGAGEIEDWFAGDAGKRPSATGHGGHHLDDHQPHPHKCQHRHQTGRALLVLFRLVSQPRVTLRERALDGFINAGGPELVLSLLQQEAAHASFRDPADW